jgi:hypothetical protein
MGRLRKDTKRVLKAPKKRIEEGELYSPEELDLTEALSSEEEEEQKEERLGEQVEEIKVEVKRELLNLQVR